MISITDKIYVGTAAPEGGGGGGSAVIEELNVTPTTSAQVITAGEGVDGYSPVNVSAVTSSIDANITAGNIKKDITILNVTGTYEGSAEKFGATIDMFIGDVDSNGYLKPSVLSQPINIVFTGVKKVENGSINLSAISFLLNVSFPDLEISADFALSYAFEGSMIKSANFPKLKTINSSYCFNYAFSESSIENLNLPELESVSGDYVFENACKAPLLPALTTVNIPKLVTISGQRACAAMFANQRSLTIFPFNKVETIIGNEALAYAMQYCSNTEIDFEELTTINGNTVLIAFNYGNTALTKVYFRKLNSITGTNVFGPSYAPMFYNCSNCTEIHFKSDMQSTISAITGYANKWGATNATIYFDL